MSPIRYRGRHRKPRATTAGSLLRGGVLSGVLGTVAVAGTTSASAAAKPAETTAELPTLDAVLADSTIRAAAATEAYASENETREQWQRAQDRAIAEAREAAAERRAAAEAAETARAERLAQERERERERAARDAAEARSLAEATAPTAAPASGSAAAVVNFVRAQLGDAYSLGSTGPDAWDCSSLLQAAFAQAGVSLPRIAADQSTAGTPVSLDALRPGDILYWGGAGSAYHVAVYTGDGTFIGAQNPSTGVVERDLGWDTPSGAVRVL